MHHRIHVYAGTAGHSVWFSEDEGNTFIHPNSHSGMYLEARVWSFSYHLARPNDLYAGSDMGIFKWDETAARWSNLSSPMTDVWSIAQDPSDPDLLIAGTRPASLWRSCDAGATWQRTSPDAISQFSPINMGHTRVTQILFDPVECNVVWAVVEIGGVYRSTDRGKSWALLDNGLISTDMHGIAVVPRPNKTTVVFATTNRGLHRSENQGESWEVQPLESPWQYTRAIVHRADDPGTIFLTNGNGPPGDTGKLFRSRNYGDSWEEVALPGKIDSTPWCVATNPADPMRLYACTNLGQLFVSTDGGDSWQRLPHTFGELRALAWRPVAEGTRKHPHSITIRPPIPETAQSASFTQLRSS